MAKGWRRHSTEKVIKAIDGSGGVKLEICRRLGCNRQTFDNYLAENEKIAQAFHDECEALGDLCEAKIIEQIRTGNPIMMMFYAKTKLKNRGYVERQEVDNTRPIIIKVDEDDSRL